MKTNLQKMKICCFFILIELSFCPGVFAQSHEIRLISHRGGLMEHDENTMQAFKASYEVGYRSFETDVKMTKDGELVIMHDSSLERTTNGKGNIENQTADEVRQLKTKKGNTILFLEELLDFLQDKPGLYVEFEMKTNPEDFYPEDRLAEYCNKLFKAVMKKRPTDATYVFTSFDHRALRYMQTHYQGVDLLLITSKPCNEETIALCKAMKIKRLGSTVNGTSRESIQKAHEEGLIVSLWPGHSVDDFMLGAYLGCNYMCTDIPCSLKKWITEKTSWLKVKY